MPQFICSGSVGSCTLGHHDQAKITTLAINSIYKYRNHRIRYLVLGWYRYFKNLKIKIFILFAIYMGLDQHTSSSINSTQHLQIISSTASFRGQSHSGTDYHQKHLRLPPWYPSRGSCQTLPSNVDLSSRHECTPK